jgi:nicotinamidase-related amidase
VFLAAARKDVPMHITLSAQPQDMRLSLPRAALLLIDMPFGAPALDPLALAVPGSARAIGSILPVVSRVLQTWRAWGGWVVHARTGGWSPTLDLASMVANVGALAGDAIAAGESEGVLPVEGELRIAKPCQGAFYNTCMLEALQVREVQQLIVMGAHAEAGVQTTLREAADRGFECLVLGDAVASAQAGFKTATLEMIRAPGGLVACTAPSQALLSALSVGAWWPEQGTGLVLGASSTPRATYDIDQRSGLGL